MQKLPVVNIPKYRCIKKANTDNTIMPIIINEPPNVFILL